MNRNSLIVAVSIGLALQLAMIVAGHFVPFVRDKVFMFGGLAIALLAGVLYARRASGGWPGDLAGGAIAGGVGALVGIAASVALKDTAAPVLMFGTGSSVVAGLIGAAIGRFLR